MNEIAILKLNAVQVLAFACLGLASGVWLKKKFPVLDRLNIPAAIVGGLLFALIVFGLRGRVVNIEPDLVLRDILMVAFFTTIGMGASLRLLKQGGMQVGIFFAIAAVVAVLQNVLGIAGSMAFGINPLIGILSGSVALTGGPATSLAFGATFEQWGVTGAPAIGLAAAMFGIVAGGLIGGPVGASLISKYKLQPARLTKTETVSAKVLVYAGEPAAEEEEALPLKDESEGENSSLTSTVIIIAVAMGIGAFITGLLDPWLKSKGFALPAYIGAMIAASVLRNVDDATGWFKISQNTVDHVGEIALNIFIVMALMTLQLWTLFDLALPLLLMLVLQAALVIIVCRVAIFFLMGRDYDSAVMCGGFCGFMMGTSANALACMGVLTEKYGPAPRAYLVVPLVGAFLIDFANAMIVTGMANFLK